MHLDNSLGVVITSVCMTRKTKQRHKNQPYCVFKSYVFANGVNNTVQLYFLLFKTNIEIVLWKYNMGRAKRICYLSPMRAAKVQASLRIRAVSPEPSLLAHTSSELRGTFRQKAKSLAPLNGWACAVKICHDGMLEDTNSLDGAHISKNMLIQILNK